MNRKKHGKLIKLTQEELKKRDARRDRADRAAKIKRKQKKMPDEQN